jgi:hypothetical protein
MKRTDETPHDFADPMLGLLAPRFLQENSSFVEESRIVVDRLIAETSAPCFVGSS